jgi:hypothetical protein
VVERKEGWKNGEVGERWGKMRETGDKGKKGEKGERSRWREKRRRGVGEDYPLSSPHRFRDSFCLFGITNTHHTPVKINKVQSPPFRSCQ